jgi:pyridoxine 5'-phosphate synthase PdxJ
VEREIERRPGRPGFQPRPAGPAGHGLTTNVGPLARYRFGEMSIGHHIISRAVEIDDARREEMLAALAPA